MTSLKEMLLMFLDDKRDFVHGGQLERYGMGQGFMASNVSRRMRELSNAGKVASMYKLNENTGVREVWYKKI